jgi:hypothetical protein
VSALVVSAPLCFHYSRPLQSLDAQSAIDLCPTTRHDLQQMVRMMMSKWWIVFVVGGCGDLCDFALDVEGNLTNDRVECTRAPFL